MSAESEQIAAALQDGDVVLRYLIDLVLGIDQGSKATRQVPEVGVPEQLGRPAEPARLCFDCLDFAADLRLDERVPRRPPVLS
jgi:hypothetical protein